MSSNPINDGAADSLEQWLAARVDSQRSGPEGAALDGEIREALRALDAWRVSAPAGLSERTLIAVRARVAESQVPVAKTTTPARRPKIAFPSEPLILKMGNWRDAIAIAAVIVLAVGVGVPGMLNMKARNQRIGCSHNLAMLGQSIQQYTSTYASALPFVGRPATASMLGAADGGANNRRHMYPLLQSAFVADPQMFICPSGRDIPLRQSEINRYRNFPDARNVSYAYFNMSGARPSAEAPGALPILSDDNPLFADGQPLQDLRRWLSGDGAMANSYAHRSTGQNVLSIDGHVQFAKTPLVGLGEDNIWTLQNVSSYDGTEGPADAKDAQLIK